MICWSDRIEKYKRVKSLPYRLPDQFLLNFSVLVIFVSQWNSLTKSVSSWSKFSNFKKCLNAFIFNGSQIEQNSLIGTQCTSILYRSITDCANSQNDGKFELPRPFFGTFITVSVSRYHSIKWMTNYHESCQIMIII